MKAVFGPTSLYLQDNDFPAFCESNVTLLEGVAIVRRPVATNKDSGSKPMTRTCRLMVSTPIFEDSIARFSVSSSPRD